MARQFRKPMWFLRDQRGAMSVEAVLVLPALLWIFMAMFIYWDVFRSNNAHVKATYTISDMITREMNSIREADIPGLHSVYRFISATDDPTRMRITSVQYQQSDDTYRVLWSRTTNPSISPAHTNGSIAAFRGALPIIADADTLILVETWRDYVPSFNVGIDARTFNQFIVARPRFLSPIPIS